MEAHSVLKVLPNILTRSIVLGLWGNEVFFLIVFTENFTKTAFKGQTAN